MTTQRPPSPSRWHHKCHGCGALFEVRGLDSLSKAEIECPRCQSYDVGLVEKNPPPPGREGKGEIMNLREALRLHELWLDGEEGGIRARLDGARLDGARLDGASLDGARLDGASLVGAHGIEMVHVNDPRGYRPVAVWHWDHWMIAAGCRWFTRKDALAHWGAKDYPDKVLGRLYVRAIRALPKKPTEVKP